MAKNSQNDTVSVLREYLNRHRNFIYFILLLLILGAIYGDLALHGGYIWDDDDCLLKNTTLRTGDGLRRIWFEVGSVLQYYPLVHSSFWLEYQTWGTNPTGYHVINIILHGCAAFSLAKFVDFHLDRTSDWLSPGFFAGLLFAVHPICVESAGWISERKNVLSLPLALLAGVAFLHWQRNNKKAHYVLALVLFAGAMFSKTVVCSLPAVLLVLTWRKFGKITKRDWLATIPFFALGISLALLTIWMEKHLVGAAGTEWHLTLADRFVIAGKSCWFYLGKIAWPHPLSFVYPRWDVINTTVWHLLIPASWLGLGALLVLKHKKMGRGPAAIWMIFSGVLFPALGFIDVYPFRYSFVADHFQYHASTVVIAAIAISISRFPRRKALYIVTVLTILLGCLSWRHTRAFHDEETLWHATIRVNADAWMAHNNLGLIYLNRGEFKQAEGCFRETIKLSPNHGSAWTNLGISLDHLNRKEEALTAFQNARKHMPHSPDVWRETALFHMRNQQFPEALSAWREVILRTPHDRDAIKHAAKTLEHLGKPEQAKRLLQESLGPSAHP